MLRTRRPKPLIAALLFAGAFAPAALAQTPAPDTFAPRLSAVSLTPKVMHQADPTVLRFTLSEPARVAGVIERSSPGVRTKGGRCLLRTAGRHGPVCLRHTRAGTFLAPSAARGANRAQLSPAKLRVGPYRLTLTPVDIAGNAGKPVITGFRVDI